MKEITNEITSKFESISLSEMAKVALLKRTDTKFILPESLLPEILLSLQHDYKLLQIKGRRIMNYRSMYFDTQNNQFYHEHHNGKIKRTKIRIREYVDSDLYFLEVKLKDGKSRTNKFRIPIPNFEEQLDDTHTAFIQNVTGKDYELSTRLWNDFQRMTLVNMKTKERATIDTNLSYSMNQKDKTVPNLVIIELKQARFDRTSILAQTLKKYSIMPTGFSKYCIGMILLYDKLKFNAFKPKLLKLKKITA